MIERKKKIVDMVKSYPHIRLPSFAFSAKNPMFIDIETTGFSPKHSMVYAIGCIYEEKKDWVFHQLFAENSFDEDNLLIALESILRQQGIDLLVHFNGFYFDIPFLQKRYFHASLLTSLSELEQFDFYKYRKLFQTYFTLPNVKLKTLEKVLKLKREDQKNGGELISYFERYVHGEESLLPFLLLHNEEDLLATFLLAHFLPLLEEKTEIHTFFPYNSFFPRCTRLETDTTIRFENTDWKDYLYSNYDTSYFGEMLTSTFCKDYDILEVELRHFFDDYKNYTYLIAEDTAIHNSLAQYVEPRFRKKATRQTAFTRKKDRFLPVPPEVSPESLSFPLFRRDYKDKTYYITKEDMEKQWKKYHI